MHGREINEQIGQYIMKYAHRLSVMFLSFLLSIFICGCQAKQAVITDEPAVVIDDNLAALPSKDPTPSPTPTPKPSASISREDPLTDSDAQTLLIDRFGNHDYTLTLLTDLITIDGDSYFAYEVIDGGDALEPIVIVNKYTGKISCLNSNGKVISFANFPSRNSIDETTCDWNGTFLRRDDKDVENSRLILIQNDDTSFTFMLCAKDSITSSNLYGLAYIDGSNATFLDENNHELIFVIENDSVTLVDDGAFDLNGLSFAGTYQFDTYDCESIFSLTPNDAFLAVSDLTVAQTTLDQEIMEYNLTSSEQTVIVNNRICYCIEAYQKAIGSNPETLDAQFYVTCDGNKIYEYISGSDACHTITLYD